MKRLTVDRTENGFLVCYNQHEERIDIPREKLPDAVTGDVIICENGVYYVDKALTEERRKKIISLQKDLWE